MPEVLAQVDAWLRAGEEVALATLVRVQGSAPRLPGARFAMTRSGALAGSVSGGCVEGDLYQRGVAVLDQGVPDVVRYRYAGDEAVFEVGLSCGGAITVLVAPCRRDDPVRAALLEARAARVPVVMATVVGPVSHRGRSLLVDAQRVLGEPDGEAPSWQHDVVIAARGLLAGGGRSTLLRVPVGEQEVEVFLEEHAPRPELVIVGATHVAAALVPLARVSGYRVTVIDAREAFLTEARFPDADERVVAWPEDLFATRPLSPGTHLVTLTHDPKFDLPALEHALARGARYVGAMGSRSTHRKRLARLRERGVGDDALARIRAPVGLDLGARSPEEVAVAILAEMIAVRYGRDGGALRERVAPIHDRP